MYNFEKDFEEFCKTPHVNSGKARSYAKAIRYLCDYMEIYEINKESVDKIKLVEENIKDNNSSFYQGLSEFLCERGQSSYLEKGFISAALNYLYLYKNII